MKEKKYIFFLYFTAPVTLLAPKSSYHLKLEEDLLENKRAVFNLLSTNSNALLLDNFRQTATKLVVMLTLEIQREAIEERKHSKLFNLIIIISFDLFIENSDPISLQYLSSSGYKYNLSFEQNNFHFVLCIQFIPCLSIIILLLIAKKIAKFR
jgi:hypothetical protein